MVNAHTKERPGAKGLHTCWMPWLRCEALRSSWLSGPKYRRHHPCAVIGPTLVVVATPISDAQGGGNDPSRKTQSLASAIMGLRTGELSEDMPERGDG